MLSTTITVDNITFSCDDEGDYVSISIGDERAEVRNDEFYKIVGLLKEAQ